MCAGVLSNACFQLLASTLSVPSATDGYEVLEQDNYRSGNTTLIAQSKRRRDLQRTDVGNYG